MLTIQNLSNKDKLNKIRSSVHLDALKSGKIIEISVYGQSMYPIIRDYDFLIIEPGGNDFSLSDIVLVGISAEKYFIHRLIKIERKNGKLFYYTKGDNTKGLPEGPFVKEQILGKIKEIRRDNFTIDLSSPFFIFWNRINSLFSCSAPVFLRFINRLFFFVSERPIGILKILKHLLRKDTLLLNCQELFMIIAKGINGESAKKTAVSLIKQGIRWNAFADMAIASGKTQEAIRSLMALTGIIKVPNFILERLESARLEALVRSEQHYRQLLGLLEIFSQKNIKAIPLKGAYLSERLYGDISKRGISADIDILIKEEDKEEATGLIEKNGYQQIQEEKLKAWRWNKLFMKKDSFALHLLWDITMMNRSKSRIEGFWLDAGKSVAGEAVRRIDYYEWPDETLLLYLCVDLINSRGYRNFLKYFYEIDKLIDNSKNNFKWDLFLKKAFEYKINNSVFAALNQTNEILDTEIPQRVLCGLAPNILKRLLIRIFLSRSVIFETCLRRKFMENFLSYIFFELLESSRMRDYLKIIKRVLFPSKENIIASQISEASPDNRPIITNRQYFSHILKRYLRASYKIGRLFFN